MLPCRPECPWEQVFKQPRQTLLKSCCCRGTAVLFPKQCVETNLPSQTMITWWLPCDTLIIAPLLYNLEGSTRKTKSSQMGNAAKQTKWMSKFGQITQYLHMSLKFQTVDLYVTRITDYITSISYYPKIEYIPHFWLLQLGSSPRF